MIRSDDVKKYLKCEQLYHLEKSKNDIIFPLTESYLNYRKIDTQISKYMIANQCLNYKDLEIKVPLLYKKNEKWYLLLPMYNSNEIYYYRKDIEFMYYVLSLLEYQLNKIYAVTINEDFNFPLFEIKRLNLIDALRLGEKTIKKYNAIIGEMSKKPAVKLKKRCLEKGRCPYLQRCFGLSDKSVMFYRGISAEDKLKLSITDTIDSKLVANEQYCFAQIEASKNGFYANKKEIELFLNKLQYPLSYLDFEWESKLNHQNRKREVAIFSYSYLNDLTENHIEKFSFDELELVKHLIESIHNQGSIIVYNALGGEALQLKRLIKKYPQYANELEDILDRIVDIEYIFSKGHYYHEKFQGKNGLKNIMRILPIESKMEALDVLSIYYSLKQHYDEKAVKLILEYNYYDTYALSLIIQLLKNILKST